MKNRFGQRLSAYRDYVGETQEQLANAICETKDLANMGAGNTQLFF